MLRPRQALPSLPTGPDLRRTGGRPARPTRALRAVLTAATVVAVDMACPGPGLLGPPSRARAQTLPDTVRADAYLDPGARDLLRAARERRHVVDRSIEAYEVTARERISLGLRAIRRERLLWEREVATRISWERDGPVRMKVTGAREVVPVLIPRAQVPADLTGFLPHLAFDPADPYLLTGWGTGNIDVPHPLAVGSEVDYRFRSGDTTVLRLPDGRQVRLLELEVLPRRRAGHLIQGSFWLDRETHAVARTTFRLAGDFDLDEEREAPFMLRPLVAKVEFVTIEYGLWDFQWWLPRAFAVRGAATLGRLAAIPFVYERTYRDYVVRGEPGSAPLVALDESEYAPEARARCPTNIAISVGAGERAETEARLDSLRTAEGDSAAMAGVDAAADTAAGGERADSAGGRPGRALTEAQRRECERYEVVIPTDTASLLTSPDLSPSPFHSDEGLLSESELEAIRERMGDFELPWWVTPPRVTGPLSGPGMIRYNRIEGPSAGVASEMDLGPLQVSGTLRLGLADLEPNGELALLADRPEVRLGLAGYRRLVPMDPWARPFTSNSSLISFGLGRDEEDFYRTFGVEATVEPQISRPRWYDMRFFLQRERAARKGTDFSLPYLLDRDRRFPENEPADGATQTGAAVHLRGTWGRDPVGVRGSAELGLHGSVGTFDHVKASLTLRGHTPLPGPFLGMLEGTAGRTAGTPGFQHLWRVGGHPTVRGYPGSTQVGEAFWRLRGEAATTLPAARLIFFSDAGWAGSTVGPDTPWLLSAGVGVSILDGLLRLDLARALKAPTGWRLTLWLDGWL